MKTDRAEKTETAEKRAKTENWMMIGGALMGAGNLLMTFAAQSWLVDSWLLWAAGAVIVFRASCRLFRRFWPSFITPQQKNRRIFAAFIINTITCAVSPFLLHSRHPHASLSQIFAVSVIVWLLLNILLLIIVHNDIPRQRHVTNAAGEDTEAGCQELRHNFTSDKLCGCGHNFFYSI